MITINKYLDDILFDFKEYVTSGVRLCDLKEVHFDAGILPDYSDIHVQQLYLLRYAYAYSFEYKRMYASLIRRMNPGMEIAVTSIGCGSMIDYWALTRVVPNRCTIRYRGIDTIDWSYRMEQRPQDDVLFRNADAVELVSKAKRLTADAYIFPKSISEFSKSDIEEICIALGEKTPLQNTVYFLFSLLAACSCAARSVAVMFCWMDQRAKRILLLSPAVSMTMVSSLMLTILPMMPPMVTISSAISMFSRIF